MNLRLAAIKPELRDVKLQNVLTFKDVEPFKLDKNGFIFNKKTIGFKNDKRTQHE